MKKTWYAAAALGVLLMCASCGNILLRDPRLYNTNHTQQERIPTLPAPEISADQQVLFDKYTGTDPEFPASEFDSLLLKVSFDVDNVPDYEFFYPEDGRVWVLEDNDLAQYQFDASNDGNTSSSSIIGGEEITIRNMTVYQYRGKNPLVYSKCEYNQMPEMERFYFYHFTGSTAGIPLNNYLAAVDTYSRFLFVYGEITEASSVGIPEAYQTVEVSERAEKRADGTPRPFYEYDPIGYVKSDGTVMLYQEYRNAMIEGEGGAVDFFPYIIKDGARDVARHKEGGAGRSPYLVP